MESFSAEQCSLVQKDIKDIQIGVFRFSLLAGPGRGLISRAACLTVRSAMLNLALWAQALN